MRAIRLHTRSSHFTSLIIATLAAAFSLNAAAGLFDDDEARKDIKNLRMQTEQQNRDNDAKLQKLDDAIKNIGVIQLLNQIEQLNAELARLRGQVEVLTNQNDQLTKRQKDFYLDIDTRLRKLEGLPSDAAAPGSVPLPSAAPAGLGATAGSVQPAGLPAAAVPTTSPPVATRPVSAAASKELENRAYDVGSNLFRRGDYAAAIRAFETFMKDYPTSGLVSNAQYWVGISYFNLKDFTNARSTQETLVKNFPDAAKTPDALLAIASIQIETGDNGSARNTLEDIVARYPASEAATKARTRLALVRR